ncbi:MAG: AI-2E family transporter, partial [Myxococcales bacterium]|nr:AI-2E family transporter [Myxococcales bacterium]
MNPVEFAPQATDGTVSDGTVSDCTVSDCTGPPRPYARALFLGISALACLGLVLVGRAVLLPFLLALVVAYVLFPLVRRVERLRVPRWVAVLLVYAATVGGFVGFGWAVVPRLFDEVKSLAADLPALTARAREQYLPALDAKLSALAGRRAKDTASNPAPDETPSAPIVVSPRADGSFDVRLHEPLELREDRGVWVLAPRAPMGQRAFSSERALRDALDRAVMHLQ